VSRSAPASSPSAPVPGLRHVTDTVPGLRRRRAGKTWRILDADGRPVTDRRTHERVRALVIPPAWTDVWICPLPHGHIQATGRDARGRKQYIYHDRWRLVRDADKFARLPAFGRALPRIRRQVAADLRRQGHVREKILAAMVRLLETTLIRVGNEEYARTNRSYGLITLRARHAIVRGGEIRLRFKGKSGRVHRIDLLDPSLARLMRGLRELPGQELFHYVAPDGEVRVIDSDAVNAYLREAGGEEFSAKDFRTWAGTLLAAGHLSAEALHESRPRKTSVVAAVKAVAERLRNTPAVCRRSYIHPAVIEAYLAGRTLPALAVVAPAPHGTEFRPPGRGLSPGETALLTLLRREARHA
jgi:DNA topoisomerase-1